MAFNITIVSLGKEPDYSCEKLLEYRSFDPALIGKVTKGMTSIYRIKSSVQDIQIIHARVLDEQVHSPNLVVVFEIPPKNPELTDEQNIAILSEMIRAVMEEILPRLGKVEQHQIEPPYSSKSVIAVTVLGVADVVNKKLSAAEAKNIREMNKS